MKFFKNLFSILCLILIFYIPLFTAEVSTSQDGDENNPEWKDKLSIQLGMELTKGNTETISGNYSLNYSANYTKMWELELGISGTYGSAKDQKNKNSHKGEIKINRWFGTGWFGIFATTLIETDEFSNVFVRTTDGIGLTFKLLSRWWIGFVISTAPAIDYERSMDQKQSKTVIKQVYNAAFVLYFNQEKNRSFSVEYKFTADFLNYKNFRSNLIAKLTLNIFSNLNTEISFKHDYNSNPFESGSLETVKKTDITLNVSFGLDF